MADQAVILVNRSYIDIPIARRFRAGYVDNFECCKCSKRCFADIGGWRLDDVLWSLARYWRSGGTTGAQSMTRGCWALVAIKARADCKSRLAGKLSADVRLLLARLMLERALAALRGSRAIAHIAVVTPERDMIPEGVHVLGDPGGGLNMALHAARQILVRKGASELLVLHADLPLVTSGDIDLLVESGRRTGVAFATDAAGTGTNALYVAPPTRFVFRFGADSRFHHLEEAARLEQQAQVLRSPGLEFDLDGPADLDRLLALHEMPYASLPLLADGVLAAEFTPIYSAGTAGTRR